MKNLQNAVLVLALVLVALAFTSCGTADVKGVWSCEGEPIVFTDTEWQAPSGSGTYVVDGSKVKFTYSSYMSLGGFYINDTAQTVELKASKDSLLLNGEVFATRSTATPLCALSGVFNCNEEDGAFIVFLADGSAQYYDGYDWYYGTYATQGDSKLSWATINFQDTLDYSDSSYIAWSKDAKLPMIIYGLNAKTFQLGNYTFTAKEITEPSAFMGKSYIDEYDTELLFRTSDDGSTYGRVNDGSEAAWFNTLEFHEDQGYAICTLTNYRKSTYGNTATVTIDHPLLVVDLGGGQVFFNDEVFEEYDQEARRQQELLESLFDW